MTGGQKSSDICTLELYDPRTTRGQHAYRPLRSGDDCYLLAAVAYRLQDELAVEPRRALLHALAEVWPRVQGTGGHTDLHAAMLLAYHEKGWTVEQLVVGSQRSPDDIRKLIKRGRDRREQESWLGSEPRIDAVDGEPAGFHELARVRCSEAEAQRIRADVQTLSSLHEQFIDLGPLAPFTHWAGPPPPEQLEALHRKVATASGDSEEA